ncbi:hypothetical protein LTR56_025584 [Elasticomyces elasticus]|nr:hypothetical protein LTR56_025584 [Elasticomyces elasticus]KAK3617911.1 hypothetical protein LTR22_026566 [Elasticomyces elasticus]KAK4902369.1 hypothetical protein LTR49_027109 [Elasticomyces elasticus]KAK5739847.1 hypothetical protein LTS12_025142 [Elasticomyces elasticus]
MSAIGADLPPHLLAKRKRQQEENSKNEPTTASGAKRPSSPADGEKRRKIIGPAMPPAPLEERPSEPPIQPVQSVQPDSDDDDDDFGPTLPAAASSTTTDHDSRAVMAASLPEPAPEKLRRDDWMTMPPKQDDLAARMDPSKQRARAFNTGKGAKGASTADDSSSAWNETPEQRQKRLRDEMMGVAKPETQGPPKATASVKHEPVDARTKEQIEKARGPSLMDKHKQTTGPEAEDDPSKRAFDREKDMSTGMRIGHAQRKDLLNQAAGFSSKFAGGSYL